MISTTLKNILGFSFWGLASIGVFGATCVIVLSNYLACSYSFYLARWDGQPLSADTFIGSFFQTFMPEATLAQLYSVGIAVGFAVACFLLTNDLFGMFDAVKLRKLHGTAGNAEQVTAYSWEISERLLAALLLAVLLVPFIRWDISLFQYRGAAAATKMDVPEDAVDLVTWSKLRGEPSFAIELTELGAIGYIAMTAAVCLALELAARKARKYGDRLLMQVDDLTSRQPGQAEETLRGYDTNGQPVYDSVAPVAYDENGDAIQHPPTRNSARPQDVPAFVVPMESNASRNVHDDADTASSVPQTGERQPQTPVYASTEKLLNVIGGGGAQVSMRAALGDAERYHVDIANGLIWERSYWETLHSETLMPEAQAA